MVSYCGRTLDENCGRNRGSGSIWGNILRERLQWLEIDFRSHMIFDHHKDRTDHEFFAVSSTLEKQKGAEG